MTRWPGHRANVGPNPGCNVQRLITIIPEVLSGELLRHLRNRVAEATDPDNMGELGPDPYRLTFWFDLERSPRNMVEQVIIGHLLHHVPGAVRLAGVEWWLGRLEPPYARHFAFGFHRDFGEHPATGELESPVHSSVLYLTTVDDGPLVVTSQDPFSSSTPSRSESFLPVANTFARFPGHLWHAVGRLEDLVDPPAREAADRLRLTVTVNWWSYRPASTASPPMRLVAADWDGTVYPMLREPG